MSAACMLANIPTSKETLINFVSNSPTIEYMQYIYELSLKNSAIKKLLIDNLREIIGIIIMKNNDNNIHLSGIFKASLVYLTNNEGGFHYLKDVLDFLSNESTETINANFAQLHINNVEKGYNASGNFEYYPCEKASERFSPVEIRNYYMCRIYYKYNHKDSLQIAGLLNDEQFIIFSIIKGTIKRYNLDNVAPDYIIFASFHLNREKVDQMFMIMRRFNFTLNEASVFLANTDYNEQKINIMKKLLDHDIDPYYAMEGAINFDTDEQIRQMIEVKLKGVDDSDAFVTTLWENERRYVFIRLLDHMDPLNAFDIARDYKLIEEIDLYIRLINNNVSPDFIKDLVQDIPERENRENKNRVNIELYMEQLHKMVYLAEQGVDADIICNVYYTFFDPIDNSDKKPKEILYTMIDESENIAETLKQYFQSNE
jgi:hypothetical protein